MKNLKIVLYWISVIPPVVDFIRGLIRGSQLGLQDIKKGETLKAIEQAEAFRRANSGE